MIANRTAVQFVRFLGVGALNTAFGYGVFYVTFALTQSTILAPIVSTIAGVVFNFFTTGTLVFQDRRTSLLWRFILVYAVQVFVNIALLDLLARWKVDPVFGQLLLLPLLAIGSFWGLRQFVFNARTEDQP
ncbi:GtrA family protein [Aquidulcibacter sp.]|uniref:GtrA family protein n=1 Tax=Aquidulcibacter sp. TaxID=2052990 RepID=UPI0025C69B9B|nr:GtrA family protein [Aquidulcibacter sp.]